MAQDPNNTEEQQPKDLAGMTDSDAAEADDIEARSEATDEVPVSATGDESADADPALAEEDEAAAEAKVAAADELAESGSSGQIDGGEAAPPPAADVAATQAVSDSTEAESVPASQMPPGTAPFQPPDFDSDGQTAHTAQIELLDDVELDVKIELGRTEMYIEDVLGLGTGSVIELDKAAGDPVDIFVNDRLAARGEVLVLNENFCVRINDILSPIPELEE